MQLGAPGHTPVPGWPGIPPGPMISAPGTPPESKIISHYSIIYES